MIRVIAAASCGLALACAPRPSDPAPTAASDSSGSRAHGALPPRADLTVAGRARWFEILGWPDTCEHEFAQTRLTDDGGLAFHTLDPSLSLVIVRCALGAYQPTSMVLLLEERGPALAARVLEFPTFQSLDGKTVTPTHAAELTGEITVLDSQGALTVLSLARQLGDCGTWARYRF